MASRPKINQVGDDLTLDFGPEGVHVLLNRWREVRGDVWAELTVRASVPGFPQHLHQSRWNLCSLSSRDVLARQLKQRYYRADEKVPDWPDLIEAVARTGLEARRRGHPLVVLADLPPPEDPAWVLDGWIPERGVTVLFADGGSLKSRLGLALACCTEAHLPFLGLAVRRGHALYVDYETDEFEQARRLQAIARGFACPPPRLTYLRATVPLVEWGGELRAKCAAAGASFVVLDSLGYAGAAMNEAEPVIATYRVLQALGVPVLAIHHVSKNADGTTPYGSVYHRNSARSVIEVRKEAESDDGTVQLAWFHKKLNDGPAQRPIGVAVRFEADRTTFRRADVRDMPTLADRLPLTDRVLGLLRTGAQTPKELAETLDKPDNLIRATLSKLGKKEKTIQLGDGRWGLPI